ncbi:MAG: segregation/condensation protein A [Oscillospiraceae bacterium]|nr:segregation/condensation protein A [Oscillospiraceae bacterium]
MNEPKYHLEGVVRSKAETLEDFDGPLDVILLLLSKNKIEIQDISITSILEQYLAYLDEMQRMDMEIASEFIAMASHLMYIKTKMLLSAAEQAEALSEMELLIRSLEERQRQEAYEQIKNAAKFLEDRNELGLGMFPKEPEPLRPDGTYRYRHSPEDLTAALAAMTDRAGRELPPVLAGFRAIVTKDPYPVTKKAAEVLKRLISRGVTKFRSLFRGSKSRSEIVATFLAILELCRLSSVSIGEDERGETTVTYLKTPEDLT